MERYESAALSVPVSSAAPVHFGIRCPKSSWKRLPLFLVSAVMVAATLPLDANADARSGYLAKKGEITFDNGTGSGRGHGGGGQAGYGGRPPTDLETVVAQGFRLAQFNNSFSGFGDSYRPPTASSIGGSGSGFAPATTDKGQQSDDKSDSPCPDGAAATEIVGNPVVLATGNKVEHELDFASGGEMGLYLARTYNHHWSATGLFGRHWISNLDYSLVPSGDGTILWVQRPDGRRIKFIQTARRRWEEDKAQAVAYVTQELNGQYLLRNETNGTERYDPDGYIVQLRNEQGVSWNFVYEDRYLKEVNHPSGRRMTFTWEGGRLVQVTDPAGAVYRYTYDVNAFGTGSGKHRLASTTRPGEPAMTIQYHYEDSRMPGALTGKSLDGVRYSTFAYDANRRAISSEHAGGVDRYTFSYVVEATEQVEPPPAPLPPGGRQVSDPGLPWCEYEPGVGEVCYAPRSVPGTGIGTMSVQTRPRATRIRVTETNPLGRVTVHLYEDGRKVSVTGQASTNCPASYRELGYDSHGYMDIVSDFADKLTDFDYNARGQLQKKVEGAGTPHARTTTYRWNESGNRMLGETLAGERDVSYQYTNDGRLAAVSVRNLSPHGVAGQVRTTTYSYTKHSNGLLATIVVQGPSGNPEDRLVSTYSAKGDLLHVENGLGHRTTYSEHDASGRPRRMVDPNGAIAQVVYDAMGRVKESRSVVSGVGYSTHYVYDGAGRLVEVTDPDGVEQTHVHDAAGRLTRLYRPDPQGGWEQIRHTYNNASQIVSTEVERTSTVVAPATAPSLTAPAVGIEGAVALSWSAVSGAESYVLEERSSGEWNRIHSGSARSHAVEGRPAGQHQYRVSACNEADCGPSSTIRTVDMVYRPTAAPTVGAPAQNTTGSFTVTWTTVAGGSSYRLEESFNNGAWSVVQDGAATSKSFAGKSAGAHRYRVSACNAAGCGPLSAMAAVNRIVPPTSAPLLTVPSVNSTGRYTVSWPAVPTATTYELEERVSSGSWSLVHGGPATQATRASRRTDVVHGYRARACNAAGCGGYSVTKTVAPPLPVAPAVSAPAQNTTGSYAVTWSSVAHASQYRLQESTNGGSWSVVRQGMTWSHTLQGKPGGTYRYRVEACNEAGCGPASAVATVECIVPPTGAPVVSAPATNWNGSYKVSWTQVATATRYELQERLQAGAWSTVYEGAATQTTLSGRSTGVVRSYQARACNAAGCGPYSGWATVRPEVPPEPPCPPRGTCVPKVIDPTVMSSGVGPGDAEVTRD